MIPFPGWGGPRLLLAFLVMLSTGQVQAVAAGWVDIGPVLKGQLARYPAMEMQDCYKLLYQACLGSEHAVDDAATAARWLDQELAAMGDGPVEPVVDPIAPDGGIVRVHLRAFARLRGDRGRLVQAFVQTAKTHRGSRETLAEAWTQVVKLAAEGGLPFTAEAARKFGREMAAAGYPAVHHSAGFKQLYRPAYRVVAREFLSGLLPPQ